MLRTAAIIALVALTLFETRTSPGTIDTSAPMSIPRFAHTATTLQDGRVLIAGSASIEQAARSAQLFDVTTERFSPLPRMVAMRHSHTATLLPNGKVLIAGGYEVGSRVLASAELFDPVTKTFEATGAMRAQRAGHVAVLLKSGKVLIAGGVGPDWSFLSSAELYDPATGVFAQTGAMTVPRESHAALQLNDGRVFVAGGHRDRRENIKLYSSAEAYDERTGVFSVIGDMHVRRHKHDAVLLADGRVLITGGSDERDERGSYNSTELFDPRTGVFTAGPSMIQRRYKHNGSSILLPTGQVLIAGGASQAEVFDPVSKSFTPVPGKSPMAGQFSASAMSGNRVLITGGYASARAPQAGTWLYRP